MSTTDSVRVTTIVPVDPDAAFEVFTGQVDAWWKRGPRYRPDLLRLGVMRFDPPGVGGRLLEVYDEASGDAFELGHVLVWKPAERLVFEWRAQLRAGPAHRGGGPLREGGRRHARDPRAPRLGCDPRRPPVPARLGRERCLQQHDRPHVGGPRDVSAQPRRARRWRAAKVTRADAFSATDHSTRHGLGIGETLASMMVGFWSRRLGAFGERAEHARG